MRPAQGLPSSSPWTVHSGITPNQKPMLFSAPANNRLESPLGSPTGFLVRGSRMLPFLSSLEKKKCLTLPRLGTAQPSMREVTLICGPVFWPTSGVDHLPRSHQVPVSTKGREISDKNRAGPPGTLASSHHTLQELWHFYSRVLCPSRWSRHPKVFHSSLFPFLYCLGRSGPLSRQEKFPAPV